jgi:hypothetical protein
VTRCQDGYFQRCQDGHFQDVNNCQTAGHVAGMCDNMLGCVDCIPGELTCVSGNEIHQCKPDGTVGDFVNTCPEPCVNGVCEDRCATANATRSYIGCDYWPVDLHNTVAVWGVPQNGMCNSQAVPGVMIETLPLCHGLQNNVDTPLGACDYGNDCSVYNTTGFASNARCDMMTACVTDAQHSPFAIAVANPAVSPAMVTLENADGVSYSATVMGESVLTIFPQMVGFPDQSLEYAGIERKAYHLTSNLPVAAYQFNPYDQVFAYSNDASLLLPTGTFEQMYYVISFPTYDRPPDDHGYATVVASAPGMTMVTVNASARVRAGRMQAAFGPGTQMFSLNQFETLNLEAERGMVPGINGEDLTGTIITSDKPIGVYIGHQSEAVPRSPGFITGQCCTDHLEEQLYPVSVWGQKYAIARSVLRPTQWPDMVRIIALREGTSMIFNPPATEECGGMFGLRSRCVHIDGDTEIQADGPILVAHVLLSAGGYAAGDPSVAFIPPTEQYRKNYWFVSPQYYDSSYVSVVGHAGDMVTVDGVDVTNMLAPFGSMTLVGGRVPILPGAHRVDCAQGCGIEVYGWSADVSYMYAGGLDLSRITVP